VYSIDLLGEGGRSVQTMPIRDGDDQAAWLATTLEGLEIDAAHLVGVSMGGWMACNQAVRAPQRIASISLLDPVNTFARFSPWLILRGLLARLPVISTWARPRFLSWISGDEPVPDDDPVARIVTATLRDYRIAVPVPAYLTDAELRSISVPALALIGGRSVVHDPQHAVHRAQALIPDVRAELWPEATHAISGQCANEVNARILRFLQDVDRHPPSA
jgi:pimeloyl-ACP methyl ester carboxylesterase